MSPRLNLTYPTALVLQALARGFHHGFDIMDATGLPSGTVYRSSAGWIARAI